MSMIQKRAQTKHLNHIEKINKIRSIFSKKMKREK